MSRTVRRVATILGVFVGVVFLVTLVNQTNQLVSFAAGISPVLGDAVLWALVFTYAACVLVPLWMLVRLPPPLVPPESEDSPEFDAHLRALAKRLSRNPLLEGRAVETREQVESALEILDARADELIRQTGAQVFTTTAISQNGSLDSVLVLWAQSKLIWRLARLYFQRPTLRDLGYLYSNVAATAFLAGELDDVELSEQIQPIVSSVLGSAAGAVPGLAGASNLLVNSVTTGTANAFLTLRVGIIARRYCGSLVRPERAGLRRSAVAAAAGMLGTIAVDGSRRIAAAVGKATARRVGGAVRGAGERVKEAGGRVLDTSAAVTGRVKDAGASVTHQVSERLPFRKDDSEPEPDPGA